MQNTHTDAHLNHGRRKFYDIECTKTESQPESEVPASGSEEENRHQSLLKYVHDNVIGKDKVFVGPYGRRKVEYCDYTASGRSLKFIEEYIYQNVLSDYGNTHTMTSVCSLQTTLYRHEARDIIRNAVNASEHDCVLFEASGATGAIHKLIHILDLKDPATVIVGPFEHHSNLLPWREMGSTVIRVQETADGQMDLRHLEDILRRANRFGGKIIGAFAAASNITGTLVDVNEVTALCHKYHALVLWDYATAAPYVQIDMNPIIPGINPELSAKDAIFISTHKFIGGVQTPGILIVKKRLFRNPVPYLPGGGTVFFVRRDAQRYLQEAELREEGGTPAIVESIRAGLVFQLKEAISTSVIMTREEQLVRQAFDYWKDCTSLELLGSKNVPRLPIFSFMIRHPQTGLYLHYNYVCALLNDLFGIQARGGCACAGPYAEDLLGIDEALAKQYEELLLEDSRLDRVHLRRYKEYSHHEILRPGFARLNLPYFVDDATIKFILKAVKLVANHGWKLLPQYNFNPETGEWRHKDHQVFRDRAWLGHITYNNGEMKYKLPSSAKWIDKTKEAPSGHEDCLKQAMDIFEKAQKLRIHLPDQAAMFDEESHKLRWFVLPSEASLCLNHHSDLISMKLLPFQVISYPRNVNTVTPEELEQSLLHTNATNVAGISADNKYCASCSGFKTNQTTFQQGFMQTLEKGLQTTKANEPLRNMLTQTHSEFIQAHSVTSDDIQQNEGLVKTKSVRNIASHTDNKQDQEGTNTKYSEDIQVKTEGLHTERVENKEARSESSNSDLLATTDRSVSEEVIKVITEGKTMDDTVNKMGKGDTSTSFDLQAKKKKGVNGQRWYPPPKNIFKPFLQAVEEFSMVKDGDRVLVCLSGGKDSLSLLHCLHQYQFYSKKKGIQFDLGAVTIDPQTSSYDPSPLKGYLKELAVPYFYEEQCILDTAQNLPYECASICSFCSRMKRGRIYHAARREHYNVLALGQHLDDLAESFLMSVFHNGNLRTMKACYTVEKGDLRVIRPFVYVREADLRRFAEQNALPVIAENCPACFEAPKERHRMKQLLATQEILHPRLFSSILSAIKPIFSIGKTGISAKDIIGKPWESDLEGNIDIDQL